MTRIRTSNGTETAYNLVPYATQFGTTGAGAVQPTFSGTPLISSDYIIIGRVCHFDISVDFSNITSFGTGQYYLTLPFNSHGEYLLSDGCLHDASTGDEYATMAHLSPGSNIMSLLSTLSNGKQAPFNNSVPVNLAIQDRFHMAGTYVISV